MFGSGRLTLKRARASAVAACIVCSIGSLLVIFTVPPGLSIETRGTKRHFSFVTCASAAGAGALTPGTTTTTLARWPEASTVIASSGSDSPQTFGSIVTRIGASGGFFVVTTPAIVPPARLAPTGTTAATPGRSGDEDYRRGLTGSRIFPEEIANPCDALLLALVERDPGSDGRAERAGACQPFANLRSETELLVLAAELDPDRPGIRRERRCRGRGIRGRSSRDSSRIRSIGNSILNWPCRYDDPRVVAAARYGSSVAPNPPAICDDCPVPSDTSKPDVRRYRFAYGVSAYFPPISTSPTPVSRVPR